jgi:hypothetical protein
MAANEVMDMINHALQAMGIGILGVFSVLAVFYLVLKLLMMKTDINA